jgi:aldose sugar dehydrogenase
VAEWRSIRDNTIYLSIGDRRNMSRAQDAEDHAGSIVRVRDDGGVPHDNPFVKDEKKDDKIFSYGHRNIQGLAIHAQTGKLWANAHGPKGGDMIHRIQAGKNYGWPFITGGVDYSGAPIGVGMNREGMESAVHIFDKTVAPSGLAFYQGDMFPEWRGDMLHGGLIARGVVRTRVDEQKVIEEWMFGAVDRRIRDVKVHTDGSTWLLTEHEEGEVLRLTRAEAPPVAAR